MPDTLAKADTSKKVDIVLKAWDQVQGIARSCDESAAKIRAFGLAVWSALIAYGYKENDGGIFWVAFAAVLFSCIGEVGLRQIQFAFIRRSFDIERALDAYMVNDIAKFIGADISTHIPAPTFKRFLGMFSLHRWSVWGPYLVAGFATVVAFAVKRA
jgi:hypothetical protein